jgi:uncharacterized phage protein gp47/JayE
MQLQLQNFTTLVANAAAAVQGAARGLVDLAVGSTLRALLEANASVALWMQWLIVLVLQAGRAATSSGADLDSWMADFGLARLPATAARGQVVLSRHVPLAAALVPAGTLLRSADGSLSFTVDADAGNPAWDAAQGGFVLGAGVASVAVMATASLGGAGGNVQPGAVALIGAALAGIDEVTNPAGFSGGLDAESDDALRARFRNYMASRSRATPQAVLAAVQGVRQGLSAAIAENRLPDGSARMGAFTVTVDDGSGAPSDSLLASVAEAVEAVRPAGSSFAVQGPAVIAADIALSVATAPGAAHGEVAATVRAAVLLYVNALPIGAALAWSRLAQLAYDASPSVANVTAVTVNGAGADLAPPAWGVVKAVTVTVS